MQQYSPEIVSKLLQNEAKIYGSKLNGLIMY